MVFLVGLRTCVVFGVSSLHQANGDDYPEAAGRHLQDANVLLAGERHDGAAYLTGYVVECAMKTLIQLETGDPPSRSHDLTALRDTIGVLAALADTRVGRLYARLLPPGSGILDWRPEMRYRGETVSPDTSRAWLEEADEVYAEIVGTLILDGAI